jgi:Protein of unknown function (DUF1302)
MTSEMMNRDRRSATLAAVIGTVLASYAGSAAALEFEFDNGARVNWNTTISAGASFRANDPSRLLYTKADGSLLGLTSGPRAPGTGVAPGDGLAGNQAASSANLNYASGDIFSAPLKLVTDVEYKRGNFGFLVRGKAWYDYATSELDVRMGNQVNNYNGGRPDLNAPNYGIPGSYPPCVGANANNNVPTCMPITGQFNGKWPEAKLSDQGFETEQKFSNAMLLDAYVYGSFDFEGTNLQLRLGNQVVNWGESIFIQGVNQINPIDVPAARRPGTELKEILLPVWMAYANWGFDWGSIEAFYQLEWQNTSIDACGTYWAVTENNISVNPGQCNSATVITSVIGGAVSGTSSPFYPQLGSNPYAQANGLYVPLVEGKEARDNGQVGIAIRFPVESLDTEIGFYAERIHSRLPYISGLAGSLPTELPGGAWVLAPGTLSPLQTSPYPVAFMNAGLPVWRVPGSGANPLDPNDDTVLRGPSAAHAALGAKLGVPVTPGRSFWEYPEDMQIFGLSAATNLFSWSVSAEASIQKDVPVQINGNDLLNGLLSFVGPNAAEGLAAAQKGAGGYAKGYDLFDKEQFQVNAVKTFSNVLWAQNMLVVAEVGAQTNNVPDYTKGAVRYGRGFAFGFGSNQQLAQNPATALTGGNTCSPTLSLAPVPIPNPTYNPQPNGCKNDGYVTDFAWGYRLRVNADYNNVFNSGVTVTPSVFWSHDVDGVSMDPTFNDGRQTLGLGLKFSLNKRYTLEANYVNYNEADFDPLGDRDFYSVSASVTF